MSSIDRQRVPARRSSRADVAIETRHIPVHNAMTIQRNKGPFLMVGLPTHAANCVTTMPAPVEQKKMAPKGATGAYGACSVRRMFESRKKAPLGAPLESAAKPLRCLLHTAEHNRSRGQQEQHQQCQAPGGNGGMVSITVTVPRISFKTWGSQM